MSRMPVHSIIISIHAPRKGSDLSDVRSFLIRALFQSTPPARGATNSEYVVIRHTGFQSTPPARGATPENCSFSGLSIYFNPRPPQGERRRTQQKRRLKLEFQSTPPARGATTSRPEGAMSKTFQSTPPARGATCWG